MVAKKPSRAKPGNSVKAFETKNKELTKENADLKKDIADLKSKLKDKTIDFDTSQLENMQYKKSITTTNKDLTKIQEDFTNQLEKLKSEVRIAKTNNIELEVKLGDIKKKIPVEYDWSSIEKLSKAENSTLIDEKMVLLMNQFVKAVLFWFDNEVKEEAIIKAISYNIVFPAIKEINKIMEDKP